MRYTSTPKTPCEDASGNPSREEIRPGGATEIDKASFKSRDFDVRPLLVIWEMTQACDLKCMHCRASAQPHRHPRELSAAEAFNLVDQVADMRVPMFVLTASKRVRFHIKTTEGQHYRRYVLQQRAPSGVNDGKGFVFISHTGEVYPSGFLPISAGNILREPLADIYRSCRLFLSLRDLSQLKGKCGHCEFQDVCGGSRARAFALTGDPLAEEPCCIPVAQGELN